MDKRERRERKHPYTHKEKAFLWFLTKYICHSIQILEGNVCTRVIYDQNQAFYDSVGQGRHWREEVETESVVELAFVRSQSKANDQKGLNIQFLSVSVHFQADISLRLVG